jgi:hypothetical protein
MKQPHDSEIDDLWAKYSKDDLWKQVSEWWQSASRARVVMLLAMNHKQSLSLTDTTEKAGASEENVLKVLTELQEAGVVGCHGRHTALQMLMMDRNTRVAKPLDVVYGSHSKKSQNYIDKLARPVDTKPRHDW